MSAALAEVCAAAWLVLFGLLVGAAVERRRAARLRAAAFASMFSGAAGAVAVQELVGCPGRLPAAEVDRIRHRLRALVLHLSCVALALVALGCGPSYPPVATTHKLASALCSPGEAWEPCLQKAHAASALDQSPVPSFREVFMLTRDVLLPTLDLVQKFAPDLFSRYDLDPEKAKKTGQVPRAFALDALELLRAKDPGHYGILAADIERAAREPAAPKTPKAPKKAPELFEPPPVVASEPAVPAPPPTSPGDTEPPPADPGGMDAE